MRKRAPQKFDITKDQPIPHGQDGGYGNVKYPFRDMKIGDSFFSPVRRDTLYERGVYWGQKLGHKYKVRSENGGARIWRVA